jgi:hypothetical protein
LFRSFDLSMERLGSNEPYLAGDRREPPKSRSEVSSAVAASTALSLYRDTQSALSSATSPSMNSPSVGGSGHAPRKAPPKSPPMKPQASLRVPSTPPTTVQHYQRPAPSNPSTHEMPANPEITPAGPGQVRIRFDALLQNPGLQHLQEEGIGADKSGFITCPEGLLCKGAHACNVSAVNCELLHVTGRLTPSITVYVPFERILDSDESKWNASVDHVQYDRVWPICTTRHITREERDSCTDGLHVGPATGATERKSKTVAVLVPTHMAENNQGFKNLASNPTNYANLCNSSPCTFGPNCTWTHLKKDAEHPLVLPRTGAVATNGPPPLPFGSNVGRSLDRLKGVMKRGNAAMKRQAPVASSAVIPDAANVWTDAERDIGRFFTAVKAAAPYPPAVVQHAAEGPPSARPLGSLLLAWDAHQPLSADDADGWRDADSASGQPPAATADTAPKLVEAEVHVSAPSLFGASAAASQPRALDPAQLHLYAPSAEQLQRLGLAIASSFPVPHGECSRIHVEPVDEQKVADTPGAFCVVKAHIGLVNFRDAGNRWPCTIVLTLVARA